MAMDRRRMGSSGYVPLRDALNQLFEGSFITPHVLSGGSGFPTADMHVTEEDVIVEMAVPGARQEDIQISVTGDTLTVIGEVAREQRESRGQTLVDEIWRGRFQRTFALPIQVDANRAEASFDNGILTVTLPKSEATRPRKIQVRSGGKPGTQDSTKRTQEGITSEKVPVQSSEKSSGGKRTNRS